jgi:hypothetical protein
MGAREEEADVRCYVIVTLCMFAAGMAMLALQGEPPGDTAPAQAVRMPEGRVVAAKTAPPAGGLRPAPASAQRGMLATALRAAQER